MTRGRRTETLAELIADAAGARGSGMTYAELSERSIDRDTGYRPSANLLNRIARGESVKLNPPLIRAIIEGLGLPAGRVEAAAHRQFIGLVAVDPDWGGGGEDDEVIRVAMPNGSTPPGDGAVAEFVRESRRDDASDQR